MATSALSRHDSCLRRSLWDRGPPGCSGTSIHRPIAPAKVATWTRTNQVRLRCNATNSRCMSSEAGGVFETGGASSGHHAHQTRASSVLDTLLESVSMPEGGGEQKRHGCAPGSPRLDETDATGQRLPCPEPCCQNLRRRLGGIAKWNLCHAIGECRKGTFCDIHASGPVCRGFQGENKNSPIKIWGRPYLFYVQQFFFFLLPFRAPSPGGDYLSHQP